MKHILNLLGVFLVIFTIISLMISCGGAVRAVSEMVNNMEVSIGTETYELDGEQIEGGMIGYSEEGFGPNVTNSDDHDIWPLVEKPGLELETIFKGFVLSEGIESGTDIDLSNIQSVNSVGITFYITETFEEEPIVVGGAYQGGTAHSATYSTVVDPYDDFTWVAGSSGIVRVDKFAPTNIPTEQGTYTDYDYEYDISLENVILQKISQSPEDDNFWPEEITITSARLCYISYENNGCEP